MYLRILSTIVVLSLLSCAGIKPASSSKANRLFETFFVGDEGIQYFIKPIAFQGENDSELLGDFNFRSRGDSTSEVIFNFSIRSDVFYKDIDSLTITSQSHQATTSLVTLTYNESSKQYVSRFTSTLPSGRHIIDLFGSSDWRIDIYSKEKHMHFTSENRKTQRKILSLQEHLFVFLQ